MMKKWLIGVMAAWMAVSLAACTPTPDKQSNQTTEASNKQEERVAQTTGGASDKVPDPNVMPVARVSIYYKGDSGSLVQHMDSLDTEGLDAQLLVDKLIQYGVLTDGTKVLSFKVEGKEDKSVGTLDLNQAVSGEDNSDEAFLAEIGNTFTENFELGKLKLKVNGANYKGDDINQGDNDFLEYRFDYKSLQ